MYTYTYRYVGLKKNIFFSVSIALPDASVFLYYFRDEKLNYVTHINVIMSLQKILCAKYTFRHLNWIQKKDERVQFLIFII